MLQVKKERVNTLHYTQYSVQDEAERILDVARCSTHELISYIEDTSAYYHRVNVAKIKFSWDKKETDSNQFTHYSTRQLEGSNI